MSLSRRFKDWLTLPELETSNFECADCGVRLASAEIDCPECGGEVVPAEVDPRYLYWDPMM